MTKHVFLLHGLNNTTSVMEPLAESLNEAAYKTHLFSFKGHRKEDPIQEMREANAQAWLGDFLEQMNKATRLSENGEEVYFVGYSLGALLFHHHQRRHPSSAKTFKKAVYLAPALELKSYTHLVKWLPLNNKTILPSQNHPSAIAQEGSSMGAFRALFEILEKKNVVEEKGKHRRIPTLFLLNKGDELIDETKTLAYVSKHEEYSSHVFEIQPKEGFKRHLFFTREAVAPSDLEKLSTKIIEFFN